VKLSFRWFGADDPVPLEHIRQIPGVRTIVSALYDVPIGDRWPRERVTALKDTIESASLELAVIESVPVHEDIKLGRPSRERLSANFCETLYALGESGVDTVCYNFMPVFDWTRTDLSLALPDGSFGLAYEHAELDRMDLSQPQELPGWASAYTSDELQALLQAYHAIEAEQIWDNLAWFLERVIPAAEAANVRLAVHPDDPPWSILGLPRILTNANAFERLLAISDSPANGVTFCAGSLGAAADNDLPAMIRSIGGRGRIHFVHCRNVKRSGERDFHEVAHPTANGDVDMCAVMSALRDVGFDGCVRPDHGRMIWGENGRPGYGLYDRALGATYLQGLWEGLNA
jgi:mannonate dehydratase